MREVLTHTCPDGAKVTLRPARPDDAEAIIATVRSSSEDRSYVLMEIYGQDVASQRAAIEALDRERNLLLVAIAGGEVVGNLAALDMNPCGSPEPTRCIGLHLARDWRGRGIGSAMLRYAVRWAKEHGCRRLEADIFTRSKRSVPLFTRQGFHEETCRARLLAGTMQIHELILAKQIPG